MRQKVIRIKNPTFKQQTTAAEKKRPIQPHYSYTRTLWCITHSTAENPI